MSQPNAGGILSEEMPRRAPESPSSWWRGWPGDVACCLLLVALVLLFYWRILTPAPGDRLSLAPGDFTGQFYGYDLVEGRLLLRGELPLWNPSTNAGHPFLADVQAGVYYPPSLLAVLAIAWGGGVFWLELEVVLHFCLAALFTYALARRLMGQRGGALLAASAFTFGGYLTGYPPLQLAILKTDVWLPLVLLGLEAGASRLVAGEKNAGLRFMGAGLAFGMAILAGHPQSAMYVGYAAVAYLVYRLWARPLRRRLPAALAVLTLAAAGLSAAQWLPSLEYLRLSSRLGMSYADVSNGFQLVDLLQLVLPSQSALYLGVVPLLLAGVALARPRAQRSWFWVGLGVVALLLSLGGNLFVYSLFYLLAPGLAVFRSQERAALLLSFSVAMLAGYGLAGWQAAGRPWLRRAIGALILAALGLAVLAYTGWLATGQQNYTPFWSLLQQAAFLFLFLGGAGILVFWREGAGPRAGQVALVLALVLLDLFTVNANRNTDRRPPSELARPSALIQVMQADPDTFRVFDEHQLAGNFGCLYDLEDTGGASPLRLERYRRLIEEVPKEFAWRLLNVKYVASPDSALQVPSEVVATQPQGDGITYLHRLAQTGPRAWVVHRVEVIPDDDAAIARLSDWRFSPFEAAIVPSNVVAPLALGPVEAASTVTWTGREANRLDLDVSLPADGLLVLSEVYYPGWKAWVDGRRAPVLRADLSLRAVPVEAGSHHVMMTYRPWTVPAGLALSVMCLAAALAAVARRVRRRR